MERMRNIILLVIIIFIMLSCLSPYDGEDKSNGLPDSATPIIESDLFVKLDSGSDVDTYLFYTNNPDYRTDSGYTLWTYTSEVVEFTERTVGVRKTNGSGIAGYGIIICSDQHIVEDESSTVFLTVMINNNGQYAIGKVINAAYKQIVGWTEGKGLIAGVGLTNRIKVVKNELNPNSYNLYINDAYERTFADEINPRCEGIGQNGLIVVIAPSDLNNSSIEVWFEEGE